MADKQNEIINQALHPNAENLAKKEINDFAVNLLLRSKIIAHQQKGDLVMTNHVKEALEEIRKSPNRSRLKEIIVLVGGSLFGAFIQGFITELSNGNTVLVIVYVLMGFIGIVAALMAILR